MKRNYLNGIWNQLKMEILSLNIKLDYVLRKLKKDIIKSICNSFRLTFNCEVYHFRNNYVTHRINHHIKAEYKNQSNSLSCISVVYTFSCIQNTNLNKYPFSVKQRTDK